jgi:hypothetical protein
LSEKVQIQKKFWNYVRNTKEDSSGVAPLRQEGMLIDDTRQKAEILNKRSSSFFLEPLLSVFTLLYCFCVSVLVHSLVQFVSFSDQRFYFLVNPG